MKYLIEIFNKVLPLTKNEADAFLSRLHTNSYKEGDIIIRRNVVCSRIFIIEKGLVKHHHPVNNRDKTIRFFSDNDLFTSICSYADQSPARYETIALETTDTSSIKFSDLEELKKQYPNIAKLMDRIFADAALQILNLMHTHTDLDATVRYDNFKITYPHLINRLSLKEIANYLDISQVSLSRIRAGSGKGPGKS